MSKVEYRAVIKPLSKKGLALVAITQRLDGVYVEASSYSTLREWAKQFRLGRVGVKDEPREGRPLEVVSEEDIRRIEDCVTGG
jgi:transposase